MQCDRLLAKIDSLNDTYLKVWQDVCNIESPTNFKAGLDAVGDYFIALAQQRGWAVETLPLSVAGNPVCITLNSQSNAPAVVFSGHVDTVHPVGFFGTPAVKTDDTKIYGPGVLDCKGGVVAAFMAMDALWQCGFTNRPVKLIIQTDEETGSKESGKQTVDFMLDKARGAVAFLNAESYHDGGAVLARKGIVRYRLNVHGKAAHSARCNNGANAITEAAHKIIELEKMKDADGLTCNCGMIEGGTAANTVAAECSFSVDIRFASEEQLDYAVKKVHQVAETSLIDGCTCTVEPISQRPAMELTDTNLALLDKINGIYEQNGLPTLTALKSKGGSDAAYVTQAGIPCIDNVGVYGEFLHSINEYSFLDSLAQSAKRMAVVAACI